MKNKRLVLAIIIVVVEVIIMALVIRYFVFKNRAYDPVSIGKEDLSGLPGFRNYEEENVMKISINNESYVIEVENYDLMNEVFGVLPSSFTMKELNGNEKYYYIDSSMKNVNSEVVGQIEKGDVMLYGDDCLVIFYDSFKSSYSYTKIGHIDNLGDIGTEDVEVSISK